MVSPLTHEQGQGTCQTMEDLNSLTREMALLGSLPSYDNSFACELESAPSRQAAQETADNTVQEWEMTNILYDLFVLVPALAFFGI